MVGAPCSSDLQLRKGEGVGVFHAVEYVWDGPQAHMAHGNIHQRQHEAQGQKQAAQDLFHVLAGQLKGRFFRRDGCTARARLLRGGGTGAVARLTHGLADALAADHAFVVEHLHGVGHQADFCFLYALQAGNRLFHMGGAGGAAHAGHIEFFLHLF